MKDIVKSFPKAGKYVLAKWRNGYTLHLVTTVEKLFDRKYTENLSEVSSQDNMGAVKIEDASNDEYLYLGTKEPRFLYGNVGIAPVDMKLYWVIPYKSGVSFSFPNVDAPSPANGSDYACLDGRRSPLERPSDFNEVAIGPKMHVGIDIYNEYSSAKFPVLSLSFAHLITEAMDFKGNEDNVRNLFKPSIEYKKLLTIGNKRKPAHLTKELQKGYGVRTLEPEKLTDILSGKNLKESVVI